MGGAGDGGRGAGLLCALASRALHCLLRIQRAHDLWQSSLVPLFLRSVEHCWKVMCSSRYSDELLGHMLYTGNLRAVVVLSELWDQPYRSETVVRTVSRTTPFTRRQTVPCMRSHHNLIFISCNMRETFLNKNMREKAIEEAQKKTKIKPWRKV